MPKGLPIGKERELDEQGSPISDENGPIIRPIYATGYDGIRVEQTERFRVEATAPTTFTFIDEFEIECAFFVILSRAVN